MHHVKFNSTLYTYTIIGINKRVVNYDPALHIYPLWLTYNSYSLKFTYSTLPTYYNIYNYKLYVLVLFALMIFL